MPSATLKTLQILLCYIPLSFSQGTYSSSKREDNVATCPYRTINYITHSLPQQCLATARTPSASPYEDTTDPFRNDSVADLVNTLPSTHTTEQLTGQTASKGLQDLVSAESLPIPTASEQYTSPTPKANEEENLLATDTSEEDSALESGNFLSFEEWKRRNLKKAGQSEQIASRGQGDNLGPRKRPSNAHNSLESLGDDGEIDIDFSGFVPGIPQPAREISHPISDSVPDIDEVDNSGLAGVRRRSKDAGTTCKERFNYASFDCAANVLKTNKEAKSANAVLLENKDSYMLNKCAAQNKFVILELCNDILIDTIVLANFEFFSSTFRTFRVSVSDFYPVKTEKWKTLGVYEARNTREVQAFLVEYPQIWARYVRIEFLTHYGNEFYCPVSLVRVHGITMMEDYKQEEKAQENDKENNDHLHQNGAVAIESPSHDAATEYLPPILTETETDYVEEEVELLEPSTASPSSAEVLDTQDASLAPPASVVAFEAIMSVIESSDTCIPADSPTSTSSRSGPSPASSARILDPSTTHKSSSSEAVTSPSSPGNISTTESITTSGYVTPASKNATVSTNSKHTTPSSSFANVGKETTTSASTEKAAAKSAASGKEKATVSASEKSKSSSTVSTSHKDKPSGSSSDRIKSGGTSVQAQPATPTTQESFFKSVQKRLQMLEANSSLSLQYIEDQSRALRDAFKKVEQRQLTKTTAFLEQLNHTVLSELRDFRQQYDQLWQSTVIELELQREKYERDNEAINARLSILADEVIFQRRMAILQMVLILVCLSLVLFSRGVINNYLELPLVQNVLARSPNSKWLNLSGTESSTHPTQSARPRSAYQLRNGILKGHRRMKSEDSLTDPQSGPEAYAPPTPISDYGHSEVELSREEPKSPLFESDRDDGVFDDPEFDPSTIERPSTSPPVLRVNGVSPISAILEASEEEAIQTSLENKSNSISFATTPPKINAEDTRLGKHLSWDIPSS